MTTIEKQAEIAKLEQEADRLKREAEQAEHNTDLAIYAPQIRQKADRLKQEAEILIKQAEQEADREISDSQKAEIVRLKQEAEILYKEAEQATEQARSLPAHFGGYRNANYYNDQADRLKQEAEILIRRSGEITDWRSFIADRLKRSACYRLIVRDLDGLKDHNSQDPFILISDSSEIDHVGDYLGIPDLGGDYGCLFISGISDGDYGYVFGCEQSIPHLSYTLYDLDYYHETWRFFQEKEAEQAEIVDRNYCPNCNGPPKDHGNILGSLRWFVCRYCGSEYSEKLTD